MQLRSVCLATICFILLTGTLIAQNKEEQAEKELLSLSVDLGVLLVKSTSTLDTHGEERISDNTKEGDSPASVWTLPLFDLRYRFEDTHTQVFFGTPIEGSNIALALGVVQPIPGTGILSLSVAPSLGSEVWKNPYQENVKRQRTAADLLTTTLKLDHVGFSPVNLELIHRSVDVDQDEIGELYSGLKRDGTIQRLKTSYDIGLSKTSLFSPGILMEEGDFAGESNSYHRRGLVLSYKKKSSGYLVVLEATGSHAQFESEHPIYNKTREEDAFNWFALLRVLEPFAIESMHTNIVLGGGSVDASIDFFDSDTCYAALTLGYSF